MQGVETGVKRYFIGTEHFARFGSAARTDNSGTLQLVHQSAGAVVANRKLALDERRRTRLMYHYKASCLFKKWIDGARIEVFTSTGSVRA